MVSMRLRRVLKILVKIAFFLFVAWFFVSGIRFKYGSSLPSILLQLIVTMVLIHIFFVGRVDSWRGAMIIILLPLFILYPMELAMLSLAMILLYYVIKNRHLLPYIFLLLKMVLRRVWRGLNGLFGGGD